MRKPLSALTLALLMLYPAAASASTEIAPDPHFSVLDQISFEIVEASHEGGVAEVHVVADGSVTDYERQAAGLLDVLEDLNPQIPSFALYYYRTQDAYRDADVAAYTHSAGSAPVPSRWKTIKGASRYDTAVELAIRLPADSDSLLLVNGQAIADGLSAAPLAGILDADILLTRAERLPEVTRSFIHKDRPETIYVIGGEQVISKQVETYLRNLYWEPEVIRLSGSSRDLTSLAIAKEVIQLGGSREVFVAGGRGEADAMSVAGVAAKGHHPVLLTRGRELPEAALDLIQARRLSATVIGGESRVSPDAIRKIQRTSNQDVVRLSGPTRHDTNATVLSAYPDPNLMLARSADVSLVDALTASPKAALTGSQIVLLGDRGLTESQKKAITRRPDRLVYQVGGSLPRAATDTVREHLGM